ncbi:solute carrier organic anion transporter family member 4A1-like [Babylonia areolata]|uniref:solute carrier organic anion transporter family member 4A1-like n=1 Tax=Babylonia areolata TaxID=304850 RepID=UPI003FD34C18
MAANCANVFSRFCSDVCGRRQIKEAVARVNEGFEVEDPMNKGGGLGIPKDIPITEGRQVDTSASSEADGRKPEGPCGGGVCVFVALLCALSFVEGISVNGLPNINISNLERRFELSSREAGLISSSGDIGAISFVLFVSFYGGRSHRPRVVGGGGFLLALGCFLFALPHIFVDPYVVGLGSEESDGCTEQQDARNCSLDKHEGSASSLFPMFIVGQALQGIGFTPAFTCGFAYIDDHARSEHTAGYIGITYAITALGVGVGYVIGGQLLSLWVDIDRTDTSKISITTSDKRWVGAWWIGYVMCAVLYVIVSSMLCLFPRSLAGSKSKIQKRISRQLGERKKSIVDLVMSFPHALFDLVCNPLYILLVLVGLGDSLVVTGIAGFAPKIIEEKFSVKPNESGLIMGTVTLMGGAGGLATGGLLMQKCRLRLPGIFRGCLVCLVLGAVMGGGCFFINCPKQRFAGINSVYGLANHEPLDEEELRAQCNSNCTCNTERYSPVCGQDGVTYFSSCYAGCSTELVNSAILVPEAPTKVYSRCSCVVATLLDSGQNGSGSAISGQCQGTCPQVWFFVVVLFLGIFFTFLTVTPISMAILRCVPSSERSVGLGLQWVTLRLLGTIPGPILTGAVLDTSCILWQSTCNGKGNCWVYDSYDMGLRLFLLWVVVKVTSIILLLTAYAIYKKKGNPVVEANEAASDSRQFESGPESSSGGGGGSGEGGLKQPEVSGLQDAGRHEAGTDEHSARTSSNAHEDWQDVDLQKSSSGRQAAVGCNVDRYSLSAVRVYPADSGTCTDNPRTSEYRSSVVSTSL